MNGVYIVNGGTQGLGEATARLLAERGASGIALAGRSADRGAALAGELTAAGTPTIYVHSDLGDADSPRQIVDATDERFGVVHGLVNVAAVTDRANVWELTAEHIDHMLAVNMRAPMLAIRFAAEVMRRKGVAGSIVNVGSTNVHGGQTFLPAYSASKAGLAVATKSLAYSLMRHRIRVNQVNPGWMDTESEDATQRRWHGATDGWLDEAEARQPMGRLIKPPEVAKLIAFLLSDESGMMTGNVVDYDQSVTGCGEAPKPTIAETPGLG